MPKSGLRIVPLVGWLLSLACLGPPAGPATQDAPVAPRPTAGAPPAAPPSTAPPTTAPGAAAPAVVRMGSQRGLFPPVYIAQTRGYFQELGIDLQLEDFPSGAEALAPLSTGELDVGATTPNASTFNALARGVRLQMVLDGGRVEPGSGAVPLVVRAAAGAPAVSDLAELRGKRVANNSRGHMTEMALERMLGEAGLRLEDVELLVMPFPDMPPALAGGNIDAAILPEPFATIGEERGLVARLRNVDDYVPGFQVGIIAYSERFAREHPEVGRRWAVAYLRGVRDYMDAREQGRDREAVIAIQAQAVGLDPRLVDKAGYYPIHRDGQVNSQSTLAILDWLVQRGYVPQRPDLASVLNPQFADYAQRVLDGPR